MKTASSEILDRLPPQDLAAERAVLGSILHDPRVLDELAGLKSSHFYADAHRQLFGAYLALRDKHVGLDEVTLTDHLKATGQFEAIGGILGLAEIAQAVPYAYHAPHYADLVRAAWARRETIQSCLDTLRDAWDATVDVQVAVSNLESRLAGIEFGESEDVPKPLRNYLETSSRCWRRYHSSPQAS
jgi:replicative DNA helicase